MAVARPLPAPCTVARGLDEYALRRGGEIGLADWLISAALVLPGAALFALLMLVLLGGPAELLLFALEGGR